MQVTLLTVSWRRVDWVGAILVTAGLTFIVFILSDGPTAPDGWKTGCRSPRVPVSRVALTSSPDIIALLIVGVLLLVLFVFWEHYLEKVHSSTRDECRRRWWTPPPLMPVSIWTRANGKLAVMLIIAFLEWCSFNSFTYWVQVRRPEPELLALCCRY